MDDTQWLHYEQPFTGFLNKIFDVVYYAITLIFYICQTLETTFNKP